MAMDGVCIEDIHGINGRTPEDTMRNMGLIASPGNGADGKDDRGNYGTEVNEREGWHEGRQEARKQ